MAGSDLPFPNNARQENVSLFGGARFGRRKRTVFMLLLVVVFFVLWFNSDLDRSVINSNSDIENIPSPQQQQKEDISIQKPPPILHDDVDDEEAELAQEEEELTQEEQEEKVTAPTVQQPPAVVKEEEDKSVDKYTPPKTIYKQPPQHFKYFMIIASRAGNLSRRQLIRKTYFGLDDNLEPCMKRDKGINYLFWVYGDLPASRTAEKRLYETEKMEWNDLEKVNKQSFNQDDVLKWVRACLSL
jgi:hypothetical protein